MSRDVFIMLHYLGCGSQDPSMDLSVICTRAAWPLESMAGWIAWYKFQNDFLILYWFNLKLTNRFQGQLCWEASICQDCFANGCNLRYPQKGFWMLKSSTQKRMNMIFSTSLHSPWQGLGLDKVSWCPGEPTRCLDQGHGHSRTGLCQYERPWLQPWVSSRVGFTDRNRSGVAQWRWWPINFGTTHVWNWQVFFSLLFYKEDRVVSSMQGDMHCTKNCSNACPAWAWDRSSIVMVLALLVRMLSVVVFNLTLWFSRDMSQEASWLMATWLLRT